MNVDQRQVVIRKLQERLHILRDATSLHIAERLLALGARVNVYDPVAMPICRQQHPALNIRYADSALMIDGRNVFCPEDALAAGFDYSGVGRSAPTVGSIVNA